MDNPGQPETSITPDKTNQIDGRIIWGVYHINFNPENSTAIITPNRDINFHANVTGYVNPPNCFDCVKITGSHYKPAMQQWSIDVQLKNPSSLTGRDVRGLVFNLGGKYLKNSDGFMDIYLGQDIHFKAFAKSEPARAFTPAMTDTQTYTFHFPTGENWNSVDYIVDASWPGNAKEPIIEDISFPESIKNGTDIVDLTVVAFDHQDDPISVTADLSPIGGSTEEPLWDDGMHNDGGTDDGIFGATGISANVSPGQYEIIIRAGDAIPKYGWNSFRVDVTEPVNHDPVIDEITISRTTCLKGSTTEVVALKCIAHDDDLDELSYHWSATAGELSNEFNSSTEWTPPDEVGKFIISCEVTDGNGGYALGDSPEIHVTQYFILEPAPAPGFTCERLLEFSFFSLSDYSPDNVTVINFWSA